MYQEIAAVLAGLAVVAGVFASKRIRTEPTTGITAARPILAAFLVSFALIAAANAITHERVAISLAILVISLLAAAVLVVRTVRADGVPRGWVLPSAVILSLGVVIAVLQVTLAAPS